ncbi:MAG: TRAM domain-containing protein, partial [Pseudobdellovibrionaceae bacterium]
FMYSPRPNTKAAAFADQLTEEEKSKRLNYLFAKHDEVSFPLAKKYENQILEVLVEKKTDTKDKWMGRSLENKSVYFLGPEDLQGKTVKVKIIQAFPAVMRGEIVESGDLI